ncbi:KxYKxGKxW signal peptide domain-containing protein [Bhargavaea massiliensis]|uniref:KxYKxGKxW signal peptide domain-containing protein n=1 Tax=Bhargavaea massiliensis TaxID=2697500 RepID=UPI003AF5A73E
MRTEHHCCRLHGGRRTKNCRTRRLRKAGKRWAFMSIRIQKYLYRELRAQRPSSTPNRCWNTARRSLQV